MDKQRIMRLKTMPYEAYLKTPEWAEKREQALERDDHRCRACNSDEALQVHHRTYARRGHEDLNDLTTLCGPCHEHFHQKISQDEILTRTYTPPLDPALREERKRKDEQKWEDYLIGLLLQRPDLCPHVCGILNEDDFTSKDTKALYQLIRVTYPTSKLDPQNIPSELAHAVSRANAIMDARPPKNDVKDIENIIQCATRLKRQRLLRSNEEIKRLIREASESGDNEKLRQLQYQMVGIYQQLRTIDTATHLRG